MQVRNEDHNNVDPIRPPGSSPNPLVRIGSGCSYLKVIVGRRAHRHLSGEFISISQPAPEQSSLLLPIGRQHVILDLCHPSWSFQNYHGSDKHGLPLNFTRHMHQCLAASRLLWLRRAGRHGTQGCQCPRVCGAGAIVPSAWRNRIGRSYHEDCKTLTITTIIHNSQARQRNLQLHILGARYSHVDRWKQTSNATTLRPSDVRRPRRTYSQLLENQRPLNVDNPNLEKHLQPLKTPVRSKYVSPRAWSDQSSAGSPSERPTFTFDKSWTVNYHQMVDEGKWPSLSSSSGHSTARLLARKYSGNRRSVVSLHRALVHVPAQQRPQIWQQLMLWCLRYSPKRALQLLHATCKGNRIRPPRHVVADCLEHLAKTFLLNVQNPDPDSINELFHLVHKYIDGGPSGTLVQSVPNQVAHLLLKCGNDKQARGLLQKFQEHHVQLHANTLLHALQRSIDQGDVELAFGLLQKIAVSGISLACVQVQKACVRLIRAQHDSPESFPLRMSLFTRILELGVRPNIHLFNSALICATEAGQYHLALQMNDVARANHLAPDSYTYRILLKSAVRTNNHKLYRTIMRDIEADKDNQNDQMVLTDLLSVISRLEPQPFSVMLSFYKRHWDVEPLVSLSMCDASTPYTKADDHQIGNSSPSASVLGLMICSYVRARGHSGMLPSFYRQYRKCLDENHPTISLVARTDHVGNAFIMTYGREAQNLSLCTSVLKDMLYDSKDTTLFNDSRNPSQSSSGPSIRTWSILVASYLRHGQRRAADKVLDIMRKRGIGRDQVAWNIIIEGLSSLQDIENAVDALLNMRKAGLKFNARTLSGLRRISHRDRLLSAMKESLRQDAVGQPRPLLPEDASFRLGPTSSKTTISRSSPFEDDHRRSLSDRYHELLAKQRSPAK